LESKFIERDYLASIEVTDVTALFPFPSLCAVSWKTRRWIVPNDLVRNTAINSQPYDRTGEERFRTSRSIGKKMPSSQKPAGSKLDDTLSKADDVVFLRLPDVKAVTGVSKTSLYALIKEKSFPAPVRLGPRAVAWVKSEIRQWAVERVQASRSAA
jgi:predicted DNA-binding transcriptional regulator AlpA